MNGRYGIVTIENGALSYLQTKVYSHSSQGADTAEAETIYVPLLLDDGTETSFPVSIEIKDDLPSLSIITHANGTWGGAITGKISFDFGADGEGALSLRINNGSEVTGREAGNTYVFDHTLGRLTLNSDGTFSFGRLPLSGSEQNYAFAFSIQDGDGDIVSKETNFSLAATTVNTRGSLESASQDSDVADQISHSVTLSSLPSGATIPGGSVAGRYGIITIENGALTYQQTQVYSHSSQGADTAEAETIYVPLLLDDGTETSFPVSITIKDDLPSLSIITQANGTWGGEITGKLSFDFGADGEGALSLRINNGSEVTGEKNGNSYVFTYDQETLTLNSDGTFSFGTLPLSGSEQNYAFAFSIQDGDGDVVSKTTSFSLAATEVTTTGTIDVNDPSEDDDILNDTTRNVTFSEFSNGSALIPGTYYSDYGQVVVTDDSSAYYKQTKAYTHNEESDIKENADIVNIELRLDDESIVEIPVNISIKDSVPEISFQGEITKDSSNILTGNLNINYGGDGYKEISIKINDESKVGVRDEDGNYTFSLESGEVTITSETGQFKYETNNAISNSVYNITFTITDNDGDTATCSESIDLSSQYDGRIIEIVSNDNPGVGFTWRENTVNFNYGYFVDLFDLFYKDVDSSYREYNIEGEYGFIKIFEYNEISTFLNENNYIQYIGNYTDIQFSDLNYCNIMKYYQNSPVDHSQNNGNIYDEIEFQYFNYDDYGNIDSTEDVKVIVEITDDIPTIELYNTSNFNHELGDPYNIINFNFGGDGVNKTTPITLKVTHDNVSYEFTGKVVLENTADENRYYYTHTEIKQFDFYNENETDLAFTITKNGELRIYDNTYNSGINDYKITIYDGDGSSASLSFRFDMENETVTQLMTLHNPLGFHRQNSTSLLNTQDNYYNNYDNDINSSNALTSNLISQESNSIYNSISNSQSIESYSYTNLFTEIDDFNNLKESYNRSYSNNIYNTQNYNQNFQNTDTNNDIAENLDDLSTNLTNGNILNTLFTNLSSNTNYDNENEFLYNNNRNSYINNDIDNNYVQTNNEYNSYTNNSDSNNELENILTESIQITESINESNYINNTQNEFILQTL